MSQVSHRKPNRADRAGESARSAAPPPAAGKPSARHKAFLAITAALLAAWLAFLIVLAVLSNSKVKTTAPPVGASSSLPSRTCPIELRSLLAYAAKVVSEHPSL
jgi:hypothetical protein